LTASALARSAVYELEGTEGDQLILRTEGRAQIELLRYNEHLKEIAVPLSVAIRRREGGNTVIDWLLLPPNRRKDQRHPLVVYFYPGLQYTATFQPADLRDVDFMNLNLLASRGYAVLLASTVLPPDGQAGDPMLQLPGQLVRAAERVTSLSYAFPDRWALMGFSYGAYGTLGVIAQSNRFKAAIAVCGVYNLASYYGAVSLTERVEANSPVMTWAMWSETGGGRMGSPPWSDSERYIRNSPLFYADRIETPVLFAVGDADRYGQTDEMFNALVRQGKDARYLYYWGEDHGFSSPATMRSFWQNVYEWLDLLIGESIGAVG
jgi:dipeptidyl aminopeptidase/acylaminoacyl peptidase